MRIDFYLLSTEQAQARLHFACRLIEKAYLRGHRIYVQCSNQQATEQLDDLLWCFKDDSFIPHHIQGEGPMPPPPVQLGHSDHAQGFNDILLNLSKDVPDFYPRFKRIIEIVDEDETIKTLMREHYRLYRQQGHVIHTHKIKI